eukprot:SAG31_NODE_14934_length_779_cov_1.783824_1_plen_210_part_10
MKAAFAAASGTPEAFKIGGGVVGRSDLVRQIEYILANGWTVVPSSRIIEWVLSAHGKGGNSADAAAATLPSKAVALHFDNGWLDTYTVAMPVLQSFGRGVAPATCFPITSGVDAATAGRPSAVRTKTEGVVSKPFMTWSQVAELVAAGWEIGAHTVNHRKLAEQHAEEGDSAIALEASLANEAFAKHLGTPPLDFAYPSGSRTDRTDQIV